MLRVTINGEPREFPDGGTILEAVQSIGVDVPTLCHDPRMEPIGACRLCVVDVQGCPRPVTACNTALADGMAIQTHTPELEQSRRTLLRLLAGPYPAEMRGQFPDKEFHRYLRAYRLENETLGAFQPELRDDSHPYIHVDMTQCVTCFRCVRICAEVQGQFVWQVWNRSDATRIVPDSGTTLGESTCVSCGACVDTCPSGALEDKSLLARGVPTAWTRTTCPYCGTGCEMLMGTREGRITEVKPLLEAPVSKGHLCVKGRYAFEFAYAPDRVTEPMIRDGDHWNKVSWSTAIQCVAENFQRVLNQHGPASVGVLGSARATNEENYLAQKFARVVLGTNNVDCCARVCHAPTAAALKKMLGTGAATNSFNDIERARTILICGCNPTENHPIVGARIKQAVLHGARLIVLDPRAIELAHYADVHLPLRLGTNIPLLNAMACTIVQERLYDQDAIRERVEEWEEFERFIQRWTPESVSELCGVDPANIRKAARLYASEKPSICFHGLGITEHIQGTEGVMCLVNLALLTGNFGKLGTGINPLRGQNNVQGSAHMGCEPSHLTGYTALEAERAQFEERWGVAIPSAPGLNLMQMMDAANAGRFQALWAIGYDVALTNPNATVTKQALRSLEFLVVQDMFFTETARVCGSVFLPVASPFEKDGTFMNAERRIQRVRKVIEPIGHAKPDWEIICEVARAMGRAEGFNFQTPQQIWDEVRSLWKAGAGISYERLDRGGLQWPCPNEGHPGTALLHAQTFPIGKRAGLVRIEHNAASEQADAEFPFLLTTGRSLYQFNAGTMTGRTPNVELWPADFLEVSPGDAQALGLQDGDMVQVRSRYGEAMLPVKINPAVKAGELFTTFHTGQAFVNQLTNPHRDPYVQTPEYKITAVRVVKLLARPQPERVHAAKTHGRGLASSSTQTDG